MNITDSFLDALFAIRSAPLPESIRAQAKTRLLDYLGAAIAGAAVLSKRTDSFLGGFSSDRGDSIVIGRGGRTSMCNAALLNGINAHAIELDDGHRYCIMHPGAPIISALLPVAYAEDIDPGRLLLSIVVGYEAAIRLAKAVQPEHKNMGYHATGTCATAGAAMAVACALDMGREQTKNALSAASSGMSGLLEVLEGKSDLKPFNAGKAAMNGLVAANLARAGFVGPDDILCGKRGFFAVMADQYDPRQLTKNPGSGYEIEGVYTKPYAACRYSHAPIQAAISLRERHGLEAPEISDVQVDTFNYAIYGHDHKEIAGSTSAKMSIPFGVAAALSTGGAGIEVFMPPFLEDPCILDLARKVTVRANNELSALTPEKRAAIVCVTSRGNRFSERVDYPYGEPENPLSQNDIEAKFISLATFGGYPRGEAEEIIEMVMDLENRLMDLFEALCESGNNLNDQ